MYLQEIGPGLIEQNFKGADQMDTEAFLAFRHASNAALPDGAVIRILLVLDERQGVQYVPSHLEDAVVRQYFVQKYSVLVPAGQIYFFERLVDLFKLNPLYRIYDDRERAIDWLKQDRLADDAATPLPALASDWLTDGQPFDADPWYKPASTTDSMTD